MDQVTEWRVDHRCGQTSAQSEAIRQIGRTIEFAATDMDLTLGRLAERNGPRIQPVDQGTQRQEVQSTVGGDFKHGLVEPWKVRFARFNSCDV